MADNTAEAHRLEQVAERFCRRGLHAQAADCWQRAADLYVSDGMFYQGGVCQGQSRAERRQMRPTAPVNVSALVD